MKKLNDEDLQTDLVLMGKQLNFPDTGGLIKLKHNFLW